jgi:hypothetical protein
LKGSNLANQALTEEQSGETKLGSNLNIKQIFVKSPPPPSQQQSSVLKSELSSNQNDITKALLETREMQILSLNKRNVKLQEENDNLTNEIERLKFETAERFRQMQTELTNLSSKSDQSTIEKELFELRNLVNLKDEQIEELKQEGLKLSKQELNQSNIIKKLRAKEKETEETLSNLRYI